MRRRRETESPTHFNASRVVGDPHALSRRQRSPLPGPFVPSACRLAEWKTAPAKDSFREKEEEEEKDEEKRSERKGQRERESE